MVEVSCPWCKAPLALSLAEQDQEQSCPECLTTWTYEVSANEAAVPLAA